MAVSTNPAPATQASPGKKHRHPQTHSEKLEDQAATAALYATKKDRVAQPGQEFLEGNKLSPAGAAASLKYANAQDLPSFPVVGVKRDSSAAGTAATLGWNSQKPFEHWTPDASPAAAAAAVLAKDYKMAPAWKPDVGGHGLTAAKLAHSNNSKVEAWKPAASANGAKAALLAHKDSKSVAAWKPAASDWSNSAANLAFKQQGPSTLGGTSNSAIGRHHSHLAAHGAVNNRRRADSTPAPQARETYPDEANAAANALKAATSASSSKKTSTLPKGGATPVTALSAAMYTSNPPVGLEVEENQHDSMLQASAVAMAKKMYSRQERNRESSDAAALGASKAHNRKQASMSTVADVEQPRYSNLQEAAQKLAQERLARLHNDNMAQREYREYYGSQNTSGSRRLTLRGRPRRRASSLDADRAQSERIRAQMSLFSSNLSTIDDKKRKADREALLAAAQRNVNRQMHGMDEQVFASTGRIAPSLMEDWEHQAQVTAQAKSDARMEHHGKVDVGGGLYIDQSQVDAVAARNVQPVIDDLNEKAEISRETRAAAKAEQEKNAKLAAESKAREKEHKAINKRLAEQDKDEEKQRKAEEKRLQKENRKSGGLVAHADTVVAGDGPVASEAAEGNDQHESVAVDEPVLTTKHLEGPQPASHADVPTSGDHAASSDAEVRTSMEDAASSRMRENAAAAAAATGQTSPMAPHATAEGGRVKSWLKKRFSKRSSKPPGSFSATREGKDDGVVEAAEEDFDHQAAAPEASEEMPAIGHVTTRGAESEHHVVTNSPGHAPLERQVTHVSSDSDLSDDANEESHRGRGKSRGGLLSKLGVGGQKSNRSDRSVSPVTGDVNDKEGGNVESSSEVGLAPPPKVTDRGVLANKKGSPVSGSRFRESVEEM